MTPAPAPGAILPPGVAADAVLILGLAIAAAVVAAVVALAYRLYARGIVPEGLAILAGLAVVAIYLNTDAALGLVLGGGVGLLDPGIAIRNVATFLAAAVSSALGRRAGDRLAREIGAVSGARELDMDVSRLVKSVGRVITVTLPADPAGVGDIEGYDPVSRETKAAIAGKTLVFPRGLTVSALRERLAERLREDHGVGHVDVDVTPDGTVEYLAVGSRAAGIGPTLVPGTVATAIRADPPYSASSGDVVQVWTSGDAPERVVTGELRSTAGEVVTVAVDEDAAGGIDPGRPYRLVVMPSEPRVDREFASLLRVAPETMGVVTIEADGDLVRSTVAALDVTVVAVRPAAGDVHTIPPGTLELAAGDEVYAIARPAALRRLEAAATGATQAEPS